MFFPFIGYVTDELKGYEAHLFNAGLVWNDDSGAAFNLLGVRNYNKFFLFIIYLSYLYILSMLSTLYVKRMSFFTFPTLTLNSEKTVKGK